MNKLISHITRIIRRYWFFLFIAFAISPIMGLGVFVLGIIISMIFFNDPEETKDPADYFTEEELRKIQSDEFVDDEEYLSLLAKYQSFKCPVKLDLFTTWTDSVVTNNSFIYYYETNDRRHKYEEIDINATKKEIISQIDKESYFVQRIIATNRNLIFRYWNLQTNTCEDVVFSTEELMS